MRDKIRHSLGFLTSGTLAFLTDAAVLAALTRVAGIDPFTARLVAIATAMVVAFFAHRQLTFRVETAPTLGQFVKFVSVAATASIINYAVYAGLLLVIPGLEPLLALAMASVVAMLATYAGLRFGVFHKSSP